MPLEGGDIDKRPSSAPSGTPSLSCEKVESCAMGLCGREGGIKGIADTMHGEVEKTGMCISRASSSRSSDEDKILFNKMPCISCPASLNRDSSPHGEGLGGMRGEREAFHGFGATIFSS